MSKLCRSRNEAGNQKSGPSGRRIMGAGLAAVLILFAATVQASDFQVQPSKLYLASRDKSGAFTVVNNGSEKIDFQISVKEWSQDDGGKDVYADTAEVVFFPKMMTIEPNGQRTIRIGIKGPQSQKERTFRLFVEEIPTPKRETEPKEAGKIRAGLTIAFRFANPIFIAPVKPQESAFVETLDLSGGTVKAVIKNAGNTHIKLQSVTFSGKAPDGRELFAKELAGWYVLQGMARAYEAAVPQDKCADLATIDVKVKAENRTITGTMHVQKSNCAQ